MTTYECQFCVETYLTKEVRLKHEEVCLENGLTAQERFDAKMRQAKEKAAHDAKNK